MCEFCYAVLLGIWQYRAQGAIRCMDVKHLYKLSLAGLTSAYLYAEYWLAVEFHCKTMHLHAARFEWHWQP